MTITIEAFVAQYDLVDELTVAQLTGTIRQAVDRAQRESKAAKERPGRVFVVEPEVEIAPLREEPTVAILDEHKTIEQFEEIQSTHEMVIVVWDGTRLIQDMLYEANIAYQTIYMSGQWPVSDLQEVAKEHEVRSCGCSPCITVDLGLLRSLI